MATNRERREVAQRLRSIDLDDFSCYAQEYEAFHKAIGLYDGEDWSEEEWPSRLADLIEPKPVEFDGIDRNALRNVANQLLDDTAGLAHKDRAPYTAREIWVFATRILNAIGGY